MTGIERLRGVAGFWRENKLDDIVEQIEREQGGRVSRMRVLSVVTEMERHVSGAEGMEDSPVARWARELREALGGNGRDHAADVSVSAYDLLPQEDREAIAWVREHGGLDAVKRRWDCLDYYADPVPRSCMEKRLARLQRQIDESHAALRRKNQLIEELGHRVGDLTTENAELRKRLMPEGCEWPRYEDGEPVNLGDRYECWCGKTHVVSSVSVRNGCSVLNASDKAHKFIVSDGPLTSHGKRIKRPAPKVYDADGAEIREGDRVWSTQLDEPHEWIVIDPHEDRDDSQTVLVSIGDRTGHARPENLTHRAPVLAADGVPLEVGQTVWDTNGDELVVGSLEDGGHTVTCRYADVGDGIPVHGMWSPSDLTHQRPVLGADGVPIETRQKMWRVRNGEEVRVSQIDRDERPFITYIGEDGLTHEITPDGLTHTKPEPSKRFCRDCAHWQKDPTADNMGVCWFLYHEYEGQDCYSARLSDIGACEEFTPSARALAERERGE